MDRLNDKFEGRSFDSVLFVKGVQEGEKESGGAEEC